MLTIKVTIIPDNGTPIKSTASIERDKPPTANDVFIKGKLIQLSPGDEATLKSAKQSRIIFDDSPLSYGAVINTNTWDFKAIDTSERGISGSGGPDGA